MNIDKLDCKQFSKYLKKNGYCKSVSKAFFDHKICGEDFLELTEADLRDILPLVGDRIRIRKLILYWKLRNGTTNACQGADSDISLCVNVGAKPERPQAAKKSQISSSFLQEVADKLVLVQEERQDMQQKAKMKATSQGKDAECINSLQWYD